MKKIILCLLLLSGLQLSAYSQCSGTVYPAQLCNGDVIFYFDAPFWGIYHVASIDSDYGDLTTGQDSMDLDTVMTFHTYTSNGTYTAVFNIVYYDTIPPGAVCSTTVNVTFDVTSVISPPSTCMGTFTPVQYCMDSIHFEPDFGSVPCNHYVEMYPAVTNLGDTLPSPLGVLSGYAPWPTSLTLYYAYATSGSAYLQCSTTVSVPAMVAYQLDLFADTLSLPTVTLHDTSSTNMYFNSIDWGDGSSWNYLNQPSYGHNYLIDGVYSIHATAIPADMYNYYWGDSMSVTCVSEDSATVSVNGASNSLSCNLSPLVHYDLTTEILDFQLTHLGNLVTSPNLDVTWSFNNGMNSVLDNGTIDSVNPGPTAFTVNYTIYNLAGIQTCTGSTTNSVNNIYPPCNALVDIYEDTITPGLFWANDQSSGGLPPYSYLWDFGDGNSSTLQYPSHTYAVPGLYMICLTITDSQMPPCSSMWCDTADARASDMMSQLNVYDPTVSVISNDPVDFNLYPNPASDVVWIQMTGLYDDEVRMSITNVAGQMVTTKMLQGGSHYSMDLSNLSTGLYFINLDDGKNSKTKKLIKK